MNTNTPQDHILVVEDQAQIRILIAETLQKEGYPVKTAADGRQALAILETNRSFSLVITDLMMPEVSGLDILASTKALIPAAEVILVTAHGSLETAVEALRQGAHDYILKPFSLDEFVRSVQRTLTYRRLRLEKETLLDDLQHQIKVRNALVEAGQRMTTILDREEVLETILEAAVKVMPQVELVVIYYLSNLEGEMNYIALSGDGSVTQRVPINKALITKAIETKQTIYQPRWTSRPGQPQKSFIIEPLVLTRMSLGALCVISQQPNAFGDDYHQVMKMLTNQAAIALQNARLYGEARRLDELGALVEAGQAINSSLNLRDTLTTTLTVTRSLTGAAISNIYLYTSERRRIDSVITLDDEVSLSDADRRLAADIAWGVLNTQEMKLISKTHSTAQTEAKSIQTWLAVPLAMSKAPVGVLALGDHRIDAFTPEDIRLVQVIAAQAATAIENAHLYEEVERRLQQTEALGAISQSISTTLDLPRVLQLVVQYAVNTILAATHSTLYLLDQAHQTPIPEAQAASYDKPLPAALEPIRQKAIQQAIEQLSPVRMTWQDEKGEESPWSLLIVPLHGSEAAIGAISVGSPNANAFSSSDEILLNTFASHASVAIQNANLFRELSSAYLDLSRHQREILQSNRTLQALFDGITDGLYIVNRNLEIIAINQAEAKRFGKSPQALLGQLCNAALWGEAAPIVTRIVLTTFKTGNEGNWESTAWAAEQTTVTDRGPFSNRDVRTYPIFEKTNEVSQVIIFAQDVSEKRRLQASLFNSANFAAVGQLASSIAHEINNPLTVIIANAQVMQMETDLASPDYPVIEQMLDAGLRIQQIVQNLLDFSTQEVYEWFETDIDTTIDDALSLIAVPLRRNKIKVSKETAILPLMMGSASHLKLLWMNLFLNALDAIVISQRQGIITIRANQSDSNTVRVQIIDNGIGLPAQHHDRLFHPFFTTKPPGKNPGLGLYICRTIVQHHQGEIEIANNPAGQGTVVTLTLPISIALEDDQEHDVVNQPTTAYHQ